MAKLRVKLTYPDELITEPVIYNLSKHYDLVFSIRHAEVRDDRGWVILELEGQAEDIDRGLEHARKLGIRVDLAGGDVVEG